MKQINISAQNQNIWFFGIYFCSASETNQLSIYKYQSSFIKENID